jgi:hypothetical protein
VLEKMVVGKFVASKSTWKFVDESTLKVITAEPRETDDNKHLEFFLLVK